MSREIKFRVWDKESKVYREGDYSLGVKSGEVRGIYGGGFPEMEVEQFTGLLDKNGAEIYEGDIFDCIYKDHCKDHKFVVEYSESQSRFFLKRVGGQCKQNSVDQFVSDVARYGILGNIHQNPELL